MKNRNRYSKKARLISYDPWNRFYLSTWDGEVWKVSGGPKSIDDLVPLIDGSRHEFYIPIEIKVMLIENSPTKKFSRIVKKFLVID